MNDAATRQGTSLFSQLASDIDREYVALGHSLGWRFLSVPRAVLDAHADIALITLNPGGDRVPPDHPAESCENGVSYFVEQWGTSPRGQHRLQLQVQKLFELLNQRLQVAPSAHELAKRSLIGHFVPFRSPRLADLPRRAGSFAFGHVLWRRILVAVQPRLVICIDTDTHRELQNLIPTTHRVTRISSLALPTGWGTYTADLSAFDGDRPVRLLRFPHLSTFQLFSSDKCKIAVDKILDAACDGI
jgi:hypothetical protein